MRLAPAVTRTLFLASALCVAAAARKGRQGKLRNPSPELSDIFLADGDVDPLAAFLRALNEDYN